MSQTAIRGIITSALVAWANTQNIPVAREGFGFDKPDDNATFIELNIIPADTIVATLDGERKRFLGEVICNVWVKDGTGAGEAEGIAGAISNLFPVVPKNYLPVSVETWPSVHRSIYDDSGYRVTPVCFSYRAEY